MSTSQINEALFVSGADSLLSALEAYLSPDQYKELLKGLGDRLGIPLRDFSPRAVDRNLDRKNPEQFKLLVEKHRSLPISISSDSNSEVLNLVLTDPLNTSQLSDWASLYGMKIHTTLVSKSDLQRYVLILFSKFPLADRPALSAHTSKSQSSSKHDPEVEKIVGELIVAATRRGLRSIELREEAGVTHVIAQVGETHIEWRIPIVFEKATAWLESISITDNEQCRSASLSVGEVETRFTYELISGVLKIQNLRFCIDPEVDITAEIDSAMELVSIVVASDLEDGNPSCWGLLRHNPGVKLSRSRSDTLISALLDQPTIIVVDYAFPELNAPELIRNLNNNPTKSEVLVVLPASKSELKNELENAGADACLSLSELETRLGKP